MCLDFRFCYPNVTRASALYVPHTHTACSAAARTLSGSRTDAATTTATAATSRPEKEKWGVSSLALPEELFLVRISIVEGEAQQREDDCRSLTFDHRDGGRRRREGAPRASRRGREMKFDKSGRPVFLIGSSKDPEPHYTATSSFLPSFH